ncbi:hypothetical protein BJ742DRAFT_767377 [Cladochytrium replicatum]|nr:hypothetical protein BJ742DRAFT_767377 [Cladochytrium replicatum]
MNSLHSSAILGDMKNRSTTEEPVGWKKCVGYAQGQMEPLPVVAPTPFVLNYTSRVFPLVRAGGFDLLSLLNNSSEKILRCLPLT